MSSSAQETALTVMPAHASDECSAATTAQHCSRLCWVMQQENPFPASLARWISINLFAFLSVLLKISFASFTRCCYQYCLCPRSTRQLKTRLLGAGRQHQLHVCAPGPASFTHRRAMSPRPHQRLVDYPPVAVLVHLISTTTCWDSEEIE